MIPLTMNETQNFHLSGMKFSLFQKGRWERWPLCVVRCPPSPLLSSPLWQPFCLLFKFSSLTTTVSLLYQVWWENEPFHCSSLGSHSAALERCWPEALQGFSSAPRRQGCVLRIPWAFSKSTADFSCTYEESMSSRWSPFLHRHTVPGSQEEVTADPDHCL